MICAIALLATLSLVPGLLAAEQTADTVELTLSDAETLALARNHDVRIERESVAIASAGLDAASGSYDPTLRIDASYRDHTDPVNSIPAGVDRAHQSLAPTSSSAGSTVCS